MKNKKLEFALCAIFAFILFGAMAEAAQAVNPALVGRNVILSEQFLQLSPQYVQGFKDTMDRAYDAMADLIGERHNAKGRRNVPEEKISIGLFSQPGGSGGLAGGRGFRINTAVRHNWVETAKHEMGHVFERENVWSVDRESLAELFAAYATEASGKRSRRQSAVANSLRSTKAFSSTALGGSAFRLYIMGLVDKVGWGAYKQAFRSYNTPEGQQNVSGGDTGRARDLLERIAGHASLRSLPDNGQLLNKHFPTRGTVVGTQRINPTHQSPIQTPANMGRRFFTPPPPQSEMLRGRDRQF